MVRFSGTGPRAAFQNWSRESPDAPPQLNATSVCPEGQGDLGAVTDTEMEELRACDHLGILNKTNRQQSRLVWSLDRQSGSRFGAGLGSRNLCWCYRNME